MISNYYFVFVTFVLLKYSQSLQSGYTCETSVTLTCPEEKKLIILEVTYSSECPNTDEEKTGGAIYAPSRCIGYDRERAITSCNGQQTCTIDNSLEQRPSFVVGQQANCAFTGQSINVDYSCIPDFYSSKLPRIDICSLQSLHGLTEGFIHTPNYPNGYPNNRVCSKTVPSPDVGHRLKIYAINFDIEGLSVLRFLGIKRINDWFQINNSGEKMCGTLSPYTLLFDDVIEASLMFKSDFANTKRAYTGFLLYFIATPIRGTRPSTTSTTTEKTSSINPAIIPILSKNKDQPIVLIESKSSALKSNDRRQNNVGLTLLVVLLSGILFVCFCAFILYKRRNDRRVRYLTDMFNSFFPARSRNVTLNTTDNNDETKLNNTIQSKLDLSSMNNDEKFTKMNDYDDKFLQTPRAKHVNINEKRENQEKQIFIENLKTCPSPYSSYRRSENKFNSKDQINNETKKNSNIYSEDPLVKSNSLENIDNNTLHYEYIDINQQQQQQTHSIEEPKQEQEEVIYDIINPNNERPVSQQTDYDSVMYATPKNV
ncbi:unnamed protein product [Rotaria sp. Silwood2]|nr:unnamed protein product [Rotaria sp. Silwood2]CAF2640706.1 unnamed protein product [Rotaria sp. Silwood2]CAF4078848.1 unnamed protein product [Rotaria sp. Silwood2]CAF4208372.1 unnamed protein product [Rotaria sp. Silwood2]